jgi:hypothetical protein
MLAHVAMGSNDGQIKTSLLFHAAAILLFYTVQRITKLDYFLKIYDHISLYGTILSSPSATPTSQVRASAM